MSWDDYKQYKILEAEKVYYADSYGQSSGMEPISVETLDEFASKGWNVVSSRFDDFGLSYVLLERPVSAGTREEQETWLQKYRGISL